MPKLDDRLSFDAVAFMATVRPYSADRREGTSLYVIRSENFCKVGIANNVAKRLENFRAGNPHSLSLVRQYAFRSRLYALLAERTTHKVLAEYSIGREWFAAEPQLVANAASCVVGYVRRLVDRWEREDAQKRKAFEVRYRSDPVFRAEMDAEQARREKGWKAYREEDAAVEDFRAEFRHRTQA